MVVDEPTPMPNSELLDGVDPLLGHPVRRYVSGNSLALGALEDPHQIVMDVMRKCEEEQRKKKKRGKLTETDIDMFAEDEKE